MSYKVFVDDNFHYMEEEHRYFLGEFETFEAAVAACQRVVNSMPRRHLPTWNEVRVRYQTETVVRVHRSPIDRFQVEKGRVPAATRHALPTSV